MNSPVVHFEIGCDNLSETVEFYKSVFNWSHTKKRYISVYRDR